MSKDAEIDHAEHAAAIAEFNEKAALRYIAVLEARVAQMEGICRSAGLCMSCLYGAPDPIGCTDCLGTGWDGGDPHSQIEVLEARVAKLEAELQEAREFIDKERIKADPQMETCNQCQGSGYGGHPDSGALCVKCSGTGEVATLKDAPQ